MRGPPYRGVRVLLAEQITALLQQRDLRPRRPPGRLQEGQRVGLDVQTAPAAAVTGPPVRQDGEVPDLQREPRTAGVQPPVQDERPADPAVPRGDDQQMLGVAPGTVPVLGERRHIDVIADEGGDGPAVGPGDAHPGDLGGEDRADRCARGPREVQRIERGALGFGDGGGHREPGAHAHPSGVPQQPRPHLDHRAQHMGRVGGHGHAPRGRRDDLAAQPDERGPEAVGVHLRREGDRALGGDIEPVRGAPLGPRGSAGPGVDPDQPERFQFGGDRAGCGPGHPEFGGEQGAGSRAAGVHEGKRRSERAPASLKPCPNLCHPSILTLCRL